MQFPIKALAKSSRCRSASLESFAPKLVVISHTTLKSRCLRRRQAQPPSSVTSSACIGAPTSRVSIYDTLDLLASIFLLDRAWFLKNQKYFNARKCLLRRGTPQPKRGEKKKQDPEAFKLARKFKPLQVYGKDGKLLDTTWQRNRKKLAVQPRR